MIRLSARRLVGLVAAGAAVLACGSDESESPAAAAARPSENFRLVTLSGNGQTLSVGTASAPVVLLAVDSKGNGIAGAPIFLEYLEYAGLSPCKTNATKIVTDADGKASFTVTASGPSGVSCSVTAVLASAEESSRSAIALPFTVRPMQKFLAPPAPVKLIDMSATLDQSAGPATLTFTNLAGSGLPPCATSLAYFAYLTTLDASNNLVTTPAAAAAKFAGKIAHDGTTFRYSPPAAGLGVVDGFNALTLVLQPSSSAPLTGANTVTNMFAGARFAPIVGATATAIDGVRMRHLGLNGVGPDNSGDALTVPSFASGVVRLNSSNWTNGWVNDSISVQLLLPWMTQSSLRYVLYLEDDAGKVTRAPIAPFAVTANPTSGDDTSLVTLTVSLVLDSRTGTPVNALNYINKFKRLFVTMEPTSTLGGALASDKPGPSVVLDTGANAAWDGK